MRTNIELNPNGMNFALLVLIAFILGLFAGKANAQRLQGLSQNFYVGIEAASGTRMFHMISNLDGLKNVSAQQQGKAYGIVMGTNLVTVHVNVGNFETNSKESPIKASTFTVSTKFFPFSAGREKAIGFDPYFTMAIDRASVASSGSYTPPPTLPTTPSTCSCTCQSGSSMPGPDATPVPSSPQPYSGNMVTTRANIGVGMNFHIKTSKSFLNLFADAKYGLPLSTYVSTQSLMSSRMSGQVAFDFGVSMGFIHNKANHHRKRVNFR